MINKASNQYCVRNNLNVASANVCIGGSNDKRNDDDDDGGGNQ